MDWKDRTRRYPLQSMSLGQIVQGRKHSDDDRLLVDVLPIPRESPLHLE